MFFFRRSSPWEAVLAALAGLGEAWVEVAGQEAWSMTSTELGGRMHRAAVGCRLSEEPPLPLLHLDAIDVRSFSAETVEGLLPVVNRWHVHRRWPAVAVEGEPLRLDTYRVRASWTVPFDPKPAAVQAFVGVALRSLAEFWAFLAEAGITGEEPLWAEADRGLVALDDFLRRATGDAG